MNAPFRLEPAKRGYVPLYRPVSHCPGCGGSHWIVGRSSAECAVCATALPLAPPGDDREWRAS